MEIAPNTECIKEGACMLCERKFSHKKNLKSHMDTVHSRRVQRYECEHCDRKYTEKKYLRKHNYRTHCKQVCTHCNKEYVNLRQLPLCREIDGIKQYQCDECDLYFEPQKKSPFTCEHCWKSVGDKTDLQAHLKRCIISQQKETFPCSHCEKVYSFEYTRNAHVKKIHLNVDCTECGQFFDNTELRNQHQALEHSVLKYQCEYCSKAFGMKISLAWHIKKHKREKPYPCDICGKIFLHKDRLQSHSLSHSDNKSALCHVCGVAFKTNNALNSHQRRKHIDPSTLKRYRCPKCGKSFISFSNMKRHLCAIHDKLKFLCDICGKRYTSLLSMKLHRRTIHTEPNARPNKCHLCDKTFKTNRAVTLHVRSVHEGERKYGCFRCEKRFFTNTKLKRHLETHKEQVECEMVQEVNCEVEVDCEVDMVQVDPATFLSVL
uniref:Zinc finger protein 99-like n=1 Tax=Saccoglossus kowalevskii TaxID=10224 RepID=A0ABM0MM15_SACKO|nr:PREDICTED: zinc finger protein 99-like [Saccoglossus kowalevskii]